METIFGLHHDTASLREKNHKKLQKIESQEYHGLTNKNNVENAIQKTTQTKQAPSSNYFEKFGSIQSIFKDRFSISPSTTPHTTPPTSRPSTPLSFDVQQSGDNSLLSDQVNSCSQTTMTSSPLARAACYHHDPKIFQNVKSVLPCVEDIESDIINRPSSPWSLHTKGEDEFGNRKEKNIFKKN
ncbi:hypothetical protein RclHR1_10350002 [Rhizophagus clarus]|uniref:Uncharacterized protein n=1 Tax=Rhizophagus clarus TaxID=94130 RepID=A0A2Z6QTJ7_9GLOM|nr:hypothetical protein RclHR1_10350002 [Rhizophagus clarus]GES78049.1 hypothetical protein GLOIN_2v1678104 [Rhizophagus clarus]